MYGMIHKAIGAMVTSKYGEDTWDVILKKAKMNQSSIISLNQYPDDVTLKLVSTTADVLKIDINNCLYEFGISWIEQATSGPYKQLFEVYGPDLLTMLSNLNTMHDSITSSFQAYIPPTFSISNNGDNEFKVTYQTGRIGLESFVLGLIEGMGRYYQIKLDVKQLTNTTSAKGQTTVFLLNII